jgi:hypothetical protein
MMVTDDDEHQTMTIPKSLVKHHEQTPSKHEISPKDKSIEWLSMYRPQNKHQPALTNYLKQV